MPTELLVGLWEFDGYLVPESGELFRPPFGTPQEAVREFLFFSNDGSFFFAKYPRDARLAFDSDTQSFVSEPPQVPIVQGTWALEGAMLVEQVRLPDGTQQGNRLELPELNDERLVVREPTRDSTKKIDVVYERSDVERFAAPPLPEEVDRDAESAGFDLAPPNLDELTDEIQREQLQVGELIALGKLNSAHRLAQHSCRRAERIFGPRHANTAACLSTLGAVHVKVNDIPAGINLLERSRAIYEESIDVPDIVVSNVVNNLSFAYRAAERFRSALETAVAALRIRSEQRGFRSEPTLVSVQNLGMALSGLGHLGPARECYSAQEALGEDAGLPRQREHARSNRETLVSGMAHGFPYASDFREERVDLKPEAALRRVLAECEQMLDEGPESDELFVLAYGQAAHAESYRNLVFTLKTVLSRALESGEASRETENLIRDVRRVQQRLVVSCRAPLTRFRGILKRIARDSLGPISRSTLNRAFLFGASPESAQQRDSVLAKHGIDPDEVPTLLQERAKTFDALGFKTQTAGQQFRRYAGDHNLPPQRYAAICSENSASDHQTLVRELFEYTDPRVPGLVFVSDTSDAELLEELPVEEIRRVTSGREGVFVFLLPPPEEEKRPVFREVYGPTLELLHGPYATGKDRWDGLSIVFIPVEQQDVDVAHVLDLRQQTTQEWFWRYFQHGDGAVFVKDAGESISSFGEVLPALVYPEFGGSGVTKSVGSWLRTIGANGLIFPSARSDVSVTWDDQGNAVAWRGWNFVDYRGLLYVPDSLVHFDLNPWYEFVAGRQAAPILETDERSWTIHGAERRYQQFRELFLQVLRNPKTRYL